MHRTLVIVRHGKAETRIHGMDDPDRRLVDRGERQAAWLVGALRACEVEIRMIVSSEAARARRTAEIVGEGVGVEVGFDDRLFIDRPVGELVEVAQETLASDEGAVALFGHNMQIDDAVGLLTEGFGAYGPGMKTGMAAVMEVDPGDLIGSGRDLRLLRMDG